MVNHWRCILTTEPDGLQAGIRLPLSTKVCNIKLCQEISAHAVSLTLISLAGKSVRLCPLYTVTGHSTMFN